MPLEIDATNWSGEGTFTQLLIERLRDIDAVRFVRVDNAPATRSEADYNFISNELYVGFTTIDRETPVKRFGIFPGSRRVTEQAMTLTGLETVLAALQDVGAPDYGDEGMLQYLRSERIVPPYQTRGYKLVELVRIYEAGTPRRS
jgi:hypothetical protein